MAKHYIYKDIRDNKVIFEEILPNYISMDDVDEMVLQATGRNPRLNKILIERTIRVVSDNFVLTNNHGKKSTHIKK